MSVPVQLDIEQAIDDSRVVFLDGKVELRKGDCRDVLRAIPDNSIDGVVTDPPYALVSIVKRFGGENAAPAKSNGPTGAYARASSGFMGARWDTGETAFAETFWAEVLRVLKPGGHIVAFSGTRTYHRMACAIEDAGFEIRDQIGWCFGCLDEQSQAVTQYGLRSYKALKTGDFVLSYDSENRSYQWDKIEEVFSYHVSDTVYRIATDHGDQIVSRNHRCLIERGGAETFEFAEAVARQREARVPVLEDLSELLAALPSKYEGAGRSQDGVLESVCGGVDIHKGIGPTVAAQQARDGGLRGVREGMRPATPGVAAESRDTSLLAAMQRGLARRGVEDARAQGACGVVAGGAGALSSELYGFFQSCMEGWRYASASARKLCQRALRPLPAGFYVNGAVGRICDGASAGRSAHHGAQPYASRVRASHRSQAAQQRADQSHVVRDEQGSQAVRGWQGHRTVVGRITSEHYDGVIWCVRVRTGAFVAVRDGFAFPTGNSGFPKSHDVSKSIDKAAGSEREVVGRSPFDARKPNGSASAYSVGLNCTPGGGYVTAPATDEAKKWDGWGTALKPAWEPICLGRKPLRGTVASNVLEYGVGGLNIDACRVGYESTSDMAAAAAAAAQRSTRDQNAGRTAYGEFNNGAASLAPYLENMEKGRWPANLVHDGSDEVLVGFPETHSGSLTAAQQINGGWAGTINCYGSAERGGQTEFGANSGSAARFFYTAKADAEDRLGSKHPTVKPLDLMQWLCRMIVPKGGIVLDPFAGTGTTGEAAWREGMHAILIEREPEYQADIARRMDLATQPTKRAAVAKSKNNLDDPNTLPLFAAATEDST